jgi:nucleotidyltransferase/DNA polymerase involved in DNA repair
MIGERKDQTPAGIMLQIIKSKDDAKIDPISDNQELAPAQQLLGKFLAECNALQREIQDRQIRLYLHTVESETDDISRAMEYVGDGPGTADQRDDKRWIAEATQKVEVLGRAIRKQREICERIRGRLSVQAAKRLQGRHREILSEILKAARVLSSLAESEREIHIELLSKGYVNCDHILPPPALAGLLQIGDENYSESGLSYFRQQLVKLGIDT